MTSQLPGDPSLPPGVTMRDIDPDEGQSGRCIFCGASCGADTEICPGCDAAGEYEDELRK